MTVGAAGVPVLASAVGGGYDICMKKSRDDGDIRHFFEILNRPGRL